MMKPFSPELQERVAQVLRDHSISPYEIERASDGQVSHQTVRNVTKHGKVPNSDHIIGIVEAIGRVRGWSELEKREFADELLETVNSRARYRSRVRCTLSACPRPAVA